MDYEREGIGSLYKRARALPPETMRVWMDAIAEHVSGEEIKTIVDVGCGTGRFTEALCNRFGARGIGVDPSGEMLSEAKRSIEGARIVYVRGRAEALPLRDETACLIYLSMVYHHLEDQEAAARELRRVVRAKGFVCLRNTTVELLASVYYLQFFPSAMELNWKRLPSRGEVVETFEEKGFRLLRHSVIRQKFADTMREYYEKVKQRALSDLAGISDGDFERGMRLMADAVERREGPEPLFDDIDLFTFQLSKL